MKLLRKEYMSRRSGGLLTSAPFLAGAALLLLLPLGVIVAQLLGGAYGRPGFYMVGAIIVVISLVILLIMRQDEMTVTLLILLHLYADWYIGLYFVTTGLSLVLLIIYAIARSPHHPWSAPPALWLWGFFLVLTIGPAIRGGSNLFDAALYYPNVIFGALLMYWLGCVIARDRAHVQRLFQCLALLGTLLALHTIFQEFSGTLLFGTRQVDAFLTSKSFYTLSGSNVHRVGSFFIDPDWNGTFLGTLFYLPLTLFVQRRDLPGKTLYLAEALLIALALLFTFSGGALVGLAVGVLVFTCLVGQRVYRVLIPLVIALAAFAYAFVFPTQFNLLFQHTTGINELSLRVGAWETAIRVILAYPLGGVGLGLQAYGTLAEAFRVPAQFLALAHPHDSYLELGAMAGLPVLAVFLALLLLGLWHALRNWRAAGPDTRTLIAGGIAAVAVLSANSISINGWTLPPLSALGWLILGACASPLLRAKPVGTDVSCPFVGNERMLPECGQNTFSPYERVCVSITGFPVAGGTRAVLAGMAEVMKDVWRVDYLTQRVGPNKGEYVIHRFGNAKTHPWQFPSVWLYVLVGCVRLLLLQWRGAGYKLLLPQDGVFTAAYTALAGKLSGARVVCIDHGNLTLLASASYRLERLKGLEVKQWSRWRVLLGRVQYLGYWPSLHLLARLAARLVDHYFIPGVAGDGVEEACAAIGIPASRLTRFASAIAIERYPALSEDERAHLRRERAIPSNALVIVMVCRLTPEKGIDVALAALSMALAELPLQERARVRVLIAGEGPLRSLIEADTHRRGLDDVVTLLGEQPGDEIATLLSLSDVFLYTSVRGACLSMAILEAMASGCAVIASSLPVANVQMLAGGRGITVPAGDAQQTGEALLRLMRNPALYKQMGALARVYVAEEHHPARFRRSLLRVTSWHDDAHEQGGAQ